MSSCYTLLSFLLFATMTAAQAPGQVLFFECSTDLPVSARKHLWVALSDLDPEVKVSLEERRVKVGVSSSIARHVVLAALNNAGIGNFNSPLGTDKMAAENDPSTVPGFPVRQDTGDPVADDAAYNTAKQAWIALYPEDYRRMNEEVDRIDLSASPAQHR